MTRAEGGPGGVGAWWADRRLATKGLVVVALPLLIFLSSVALLWRMSEAEGRAREDVRITIAIQSDVQMAHALLAEAANGARGYLLTGQPRFLAPYREAEDSLGPVLRRARGLVRDAEARRRLDRVEALAAAGRRGLDALVAERARGGGAVVGRPAVLAALVENTRVLDALREEINRVQARERVLLAERQARADAVRRRELALTGAVMLAGVAGSLVAVLLFSSGIVRRVHRLRESAARLGRGEPPLPLPPARDELGELGGRVAEASALLRAREAARRESEERLRLVVEGVRDYGIFALDVDGRVASWNLGAERIKGWRADEVLGQHFSVFYPEEERAARPARNLAEARRHGRTEDEGWRVRKDGTRFLANVVITALHDDAGTLRGFAKITRDITERRLAEEAVEAARREAVAASAAKSQFLSRMSHELRTPLNAILGFAQLLELDARDGAPDRSPDEREGVAQILHAGRHLLALIDEVLDISRIESGQVAFALAPTALAGVAAEAAALTRPQARVAGVEVRVAVDPALHVRADRRRLLQALLNLVTNGVKFGRAGGRVDVTARADGDVVAVEVADDGIGVEPELAGRLFTPFARLGRAAEARDGTGLGLALSRGLARAMGGDITHNPRDDGRPGAVFRLTLPSAPAPAAPDPSVPNDQPRAAGAPAAAGPTILLVEDNLANARLIEQVVARACPGATLLLAMQATIGVQLARQHAPALVLVDLHLPDRPGTWVLEQLAALPERPPAFVLTADLTATAGGGLEGTPAGLAARVFPKPLDVPALVAALREQVGTPPPPPPPRAEAEPAEPQPAEPQPAEAAAC